MAKGAYIGVPTLSASLGDFEVGATVKMNVNGEPRDFIIVQKGNPDSSKYDASCDGIWLLMKDLYVARAYSSSTCNYNASSVHTYLNGTFLGCLDAGVQSAIKQVKIPYCTWNGSSRSDFKGEQGLSTKVFLLSGAEVNIQGGYVPYEESVQLSYFVAAPAEKRIAYFNGNVGGWWTRTPYCRGTTTAAIVNIDGSSSNNSANGSGIYVRPAMILPADTGVRGGFIDGSKTALIPVARKVKKGYIGVPKAEYEPVFADNSWAQIIKACQKNEVLDTWSVGDQKAMDIGGTEYLIDIIGVNHDDYADGSGKAPLTFQLHDCYADTLSMNSSTTNIGGWTGCEMRLTYLPNILSLMPTEVQAGIKEVNKLTSAGSLSTNIDTTADKLFLLSEIEIFGAVSMAANGEGEQYAYYSNGGSKVKMNSSRGVAGRWWERSPLVNSNFSTSFCLVATNGTYSNNNANSVNLVAPAFCFGGTSEVNNVFGGYSLAHKIKKAYIGIGGVARPCWSGGELAYYGTITPLSEARRMLGATSVGNYALFGGGTANGGISGVVDAYNTSLVRSTPNSFNSSGDNEATTVGKYAVFGGYGVHAYDESLTLTQKDTDTIVCGGNAAATTVGNYALFHYGSGAGDITAYDASLTKTKPTPMASSRDRLAATSVGDYALFGGGARTRYGSNACIDVVNVFNSSLTQSTATPLSIGRFFLAATTIGNHALFAGGDTPADASVHVPTDAVDVYDSSLSKSITTLSTAKYNFAATTVGNYALFGGGIDVSTGAVVDAFDQNLTRTTPTGLSGYRDYLAATSVGDYALFGGGRASFLSDAVDVYTIV